MCMVVTLTLTLQPRHRELLRDPTVTHSAAPPRGTSRWNLRQNPAAAVSTLTPSSLFPDSLLKTPDERNLSTKCFRDSFSVFPLALGFLHALGRAAQWGAEASLILPCSTRAGLSQKVIQTRGHLVTSIPLGANTSSFLLERNTKGTQFKRRRVSPSVGSSILLHTFGQAYSMGLMGSMEH